MATVGKIYLFVSGCGHSGSTFLQFLLNQNYDVLCVGEIGNSVRHISDKNFERTKNQLCSCGKHGCDCEFWGSIVQDTIRSATELVASVEEKASKFNSPTVIDSSKRIRHYDLFTHMNPKVIYLVRDSRGWALSEIRNKKRKSKYQQRRNFGYVYESYRWFWQNVRDIVLFRKRKASLLYVSYERLVFDTDAELNRLAEFAQLNSREDVEAETHILHGNRMRHNQKDRERVVYNPAWIFSVKPLVFSIFVLPVYILNFVLNKLAERNVG